MNDLQPAQPQRPAAPRGAVILVTGLVGALVGLLMLILIGAAVDVLTAWVARQRSLALGAVCYLLALALPGSLMTLATRARSSVAIPLSLPSALACLLATLPLAARGPLGETFRAMGGTAAVASVACLGFAVSTAGGFIGFLFAKRRARRPSLKRRAL